MNIAIWFGISPWCQRCYQKFNQSSSTLGYSFFSSRVLKNTQFEFMLKNILTLHLVQNFPWVPEMISKIQSDPSPLGYSIFFSSNCLKKYTIWVYVDKYLNIVRLFRISPGSRNDIANLIRLLNTGLEAISSTSKPGIYLFIAESTDLYWGKGTW